MPGKRNPGYCIFKKFTIRQQDSAIKVGSDSVLLGSWAGVSGTSRALDIGTGTGVMALMLAQRNPGLFVEGIEIDAPSAAEARFNVKQSPWAERIRIHAKDINSYIPEVPYDLLVCNPPFYRHGHGKPSPDARRAAGRQTLALDYPQLACLASRLLTPSGHLAVILPADEGAGFLALAEHKGLFCQRKLVVFPLPERKAHRWLLEFETTPGPCQEDELIMEYKHHTYTPEMISLTRVFYRGL